MTTTRLFIAVEISDQIRRSAERLARRWRDCGADVAWVRADNLHLTIKFLGQMPNERLEAIGRAVTAAAAAAAPFRIRCRGAGAFPHTRRPQVVWLGVDQGRGELQRLHGLVEQHLQPLGFPPDDRPFHPHLTLGRLRRSRRGQAELGRVVERDAAFDAGEAHVGQLVLFASRLSRQGAAYEPLRRAPLGSPPAPPPP